MREGKLSRFLEVEMAKEDKKVEAVCLMDCIFGKATEIVSLSADDAKVGADNGIVDLNQAAIKAAKDNK